MKNLKLSILLLILSFKPVFSQVSTITYELTARNLSLEAVNSYPQKLISYQKNDTLYRIVVSTFGAWEDTIKRKIVINDRRGSGSDHRLPAGSGRLSDSQSLFRKTIRPHTGNHRMGPGMSSRMAH